MEARLRSLTGAAFFVTSSRLVNTSRERYFRVGTRIHGIYDHTRTHHYSFDHKNQHIIAQELYTINKQNQPVSACIHSVAMYAPFYYSFLVDGRMKRHQILNYFPKLDELIKIQGIPPPLPLFVGNEMISSVNSSTNSVMLLSFTFRQVNSQFTREFSV